MGADEGELFREEVALFAEHFLDLAHGRIVGAEGDDPGDRLALRRAVVGLAGKDEDVAGVLSFIGMQIADLSFAAEGADELRVSARKDGQNFSFVVRAAAHGDTKHRVAVEGVLDGAAGDEEIGRAVFGDDEAEAAFVARERAFLCAELFGGAVAVTAVRKQLAFADEGAQNVAKPQALLSSELQALCDLLIGEKGEGAVLDFL